MNDREKGFSLIEVIIVMAVMGIIMAMNNQLLQEMMRGQRQQSTIVSSQFETALALEILRSDVANAGFGLPDEFQSAIAYVEAVGDPAQQFNDSPSNVPRPIVHNNNVGAFGTYLTNSDYLVIKSPVVGMNSASGKWTNIKGTSVHVWNDLALDMTNGSDYMIVVKPRTVGGSKAQLIVSGATYALQYTTAALSAGFQPTGGTDARYLAYGLTENVLPSMPFNRADYYVRQNIVNTACAANTGTLIKATVNQGGGGGITEYPLIECAANMQVVFRLDTNQDGIPDQTVNDISGKDAYTLKEQIKEVRVYILAHEGTADTGGFRYANSTVIVGPDAVLGTIVNLANFGTNWNRYRWKIYTLNVKPKSFY